MKRLDRVDERFIHKMQLGRDICPSDARNNSPSHVMIVLGGHMFNGGVATFVYDVFWDLMKLNYY